MKTVRLEIKKELDRQRDADSVYVTITVEGDGILVKGESFNILSSGTYHLGHELERDLEKAGIDPYDVVEALEEFKRAITVELAFPVMGLKEKLDTYAKTALDLKLFSVASRLCTALETAHRVDMNSPADFGGEWASIECDIEAVDEAMKRANEDDLDARERFEGEQLAKSGMLY